MAPQKNMSPEEMGAWATLATMGVSVLWFIVRPLIISLHRMFGKKAFAGEWQALAETRADVKQMKDTDLPELKADCKEALECAKRTEAQVTHLSQLLMQKAVMGPTDVGKPTPS